MRASPAPVEEQGLSPAGLKELVARKAELELEELVARKELVARQAELVARLEEALRVTKQSHDHDMITTRESPIRTTFHLLSVCFRRHGERH